MSTRRFSTFLLGEQLFGIDILYVREINKNLDITHVQHAPAYIRGLVNLRGQIVTVMDLNQLLGQAQQHISETSYNVILKTDHELASIREREDRDDINTVGDIVSFLVDDIGDVVTVDHEEISPPPANIGTVDSKYLSGVVKLDNTLMAVIRVDKVLLQSSN